MGAVLGLASVAQLACCCTGTACSLCCAACPSCRNSTSTRLMYAIMLLIGAIISGIALAPGLQDWLKKVPFCANSTSTSSHFIPSEVTADCSVAVGYLAVYRICFAFACFFALMAVIMIGAQSSRDARAGIQNGFWGIKYLIVIAIAVGAFFIPNGEFGTIWMSIGLIGGVIFILVQLVLLVDFAHSWAETWVANYEENESRGWYCALLSATAIQYVVAITGIALLYTYYNCGVNIALISLNLVLCLCVSILSIMPQVQERISRSGLLQSSVVTLYVVYLTWSALSNNPNEKCHSEIFPSGGSSKITIDKTSIVGMIIWMVCLLYSSLKSASKVSELTVPDVEKQAKESGESHKPIDSGDNGAKVYDNEENGVAYSWSLFHVVFVAATLYIMMTLTNWYQPNSKLETLNTNAASMWIKIVSSWACVGLYGWSLIAPIVLTDRIFE
ncbi:probable serine incorporator isoform X2 [Sitodiplosis mosellana]|uniref:probable serine incorporator isoform X2 n=1 Tax=Sitodiplosis mosellana TaxID=263140 RepID=UPI002444595A|nr:probable serine incorporator isoform X2 [Sitodiplosis mosellana]